MHLHVACCRPSYTLTIGTGVLAAGLQPTVPGVWVPLQHLVQHCPKLHEASVFSEIILLMLTEERVGPAIVANEGDFLGLVLVSTTPERQTIGTEHLQIKPGPPIMQGYGGQ